MSRRPVPLERPVYSTDGVLALPYDQWDLQAVAAQFKRLWNRPTFRAIRKELNRRQQRSERPPPHRPCEYLREALFALYVLAILQGTNIKHVYDAVIEHPELFDDTICLRSLRDANRVARQNVVTDFLRWLEHAPCSDDDPLTFIRRQAHVELVAEALKADTTCRPNFHTTRLVADVKPVISPITKRTSDRARNGVRGKDDEGAGWVVHKKQPIWGRHLCSVVLGCPPLVVASDIRCLGSEMNLMRQVLDVQLRENLAEITARLPPDHHGFRRAGLIWDNLYYNDPFARLAMSLDLIPMWASSDRRLAGTIRANEIDGLNRRTGQQTTLTLRYDGALICPDCRKKNIADCSKMQRLLPLNGSPRAFRVCCTDPACPSSGRIFAASIDTPITYPSGSRARRNAAYLAQLGACDALVRDLVSHHRQPSECCFSLLAHFNLGHTDRSTRRQLYGDFSHRFTYALADLIRNELIWQQLRERTEPLPVISRQRLHQARVQQDTEVARKRSERAESNNSGTPRRRPSRDELSKLDADLRDAYRHDGIPFDG